MTDPCHRLPAQMVLALEDRTTTEANRAPMPWAFNRDRLSQLDLAQWPTSIEPAPARGKTLPILVRDALMDDEAQPTLADRLALSYRSDQV